MKRALAAGSRFRLVGSVAVSAVRSLAFTRGGAG